MPEPIHQDDPLDIPDAPLGDMLDEYHDDPVGPSGASPTHSPGSNREIAIPFSVRSG
ncbi:hypothetical protein EDC04DRAFT_2911958 [Pisolithus marmoratus]|nr:hypothetical protein EDC04DRAFT_2911958 [Pisolithus marmoratus]